MRKERIYFIFAFIAIVSLAFYFYNKNSNQKNKYLWFKTYTDNVKQPYDFGMFKDLLEHDTKDFEVLDNEMDVSLSTHDSTKVGTYVFIGADYFLNKNELNALLSFVQKGNNAIVIAEAFPSILLDDINRQNAGLELKRKEAEKVKVQSNYHNSRLNPFEFKYLGLKKKPEVTAWMYLGKKNKDYYYNNSYLIQSTINDKINQIALYKGEGTLIINTTPIFFTNYAMLSDTGFNYVNEMLSNAKTGHVYYDVYSRNLKQNSSKMSRKSDTPLSFILKHPPLRTAWYLFLALVLLFLLFKAKRTQKIIPVIEQKRNTTLGFVETLSRMHYLRADHKQMAINQMQIFLFFVRNKLKIPTGDLNARTIKLISVKSNVPESHVHDIVEFYKNTIETTDDLSAEYLMRFYNMINKFYKIYQKK